MTPISSLLILFIALKLCGVIDWSWVWVLAPLWLSILWYFTVGLLIEIKKGRRR